MEVEQRCKVPCSIQHRMRVYDGQQYRSVVGGSVFHLLLVADAPDMTFETCDRCGKVQSRDMVFPWATSAFRLP